MCNIYGFVKGLLHTEPQFINCQVRGTDDNTLYTSGYNVEEVKEVLLNDLNKVREQFCENYMVLNDGEMSFYVPWQKYRN